MKKLFLIAIVGLALFNTSCSKDENPPTPQVEETQPAVDPLAHMTDNFIHSNLNIGMWIETNIHHSGPNGTYDEPGSDTLIFTTTELTWDFGATTFDYIVQNRIIDNGPFGNSFVPMPVSFMSTNGEIMKIKMASDITGFTTMEMEFHRSL